MRQQNDVPGFVVIGAAGPMALTKAGLFFGVRRASLMTVFASREEARMAIKEVVARRKRQGLTTEWLDMRVIRLLAASATQGGPVKPLLRVQWKQNGEIFEAQRKSGVIEFNRPGEAGRWRSMPEAEFWKYFDPVEPEEQKGLFV